MPVFHFEYNLYMPTSERTVMVLDKYVFPANHHFVPGLFIQMIFLCWFLVVKQVIPKEIDLEKMKEDAVVDAEKSAIPAFLFQVSKKFV